MSGWMLTRSQDLYHLLRGWISLMLLTVAPIGLTVNAQNLIWNIDVASFEGQFSALVSTGRGTFSFSLVNNLDQQIAYRANTDTRTYHDVWRSAEYRQRLRSMPILLQQDHDAVLILSDRGIGLLSDENTFTTFYEDCLDSTYGFDVVRKTGVNTFDVMLQRKQDTVVNSIYAILTVEQWRQNECKRIWKGLAASSYGWAKNFFFDYNDSLNLTYGNRKSGDTILIRTGSGKAVKLSGLNYPELRYVDSVWRDPWSWTMFVGKTIATIDNAIVRLKSDFSVIDEIPLDTRFERVQSIQRVGDRICISTPKKVVVVDLERNTSSSISVSKIASDIGAGPNMTIQSATDDGSRTYIMSTSGIHVYGTITSVEPDEVAKPSPRSIVVESLDQIIYRRHFSQLSTSISVYDITGRILDSIPVHDMELQVVSPTNIYTGTVVLVTSAGESLLVMIR